MPGINLSRILANVRGWHTHRKIIVFESDDWGSIRMPDRATYDVLLSKGVRVDKCPYNRYDCLASEEDLTSLFEVLRSYRDYFGNHPAITANCVVVNPDFEKIRNSDFKEYHYELFTDTLNRYPNHLKSFRLWNEGISQNIFHPEFHGREHLHVARWMQALKQNLPETRLAFDLHLFGLSTFISKENRRSYLAACDVNTSEGLDQVKNILTDGLSIFRKLFGHPANAFIAPNYIWPSQIEEYLSDQNVRFLKGGIIQSSPVLNSSKNKIIRHYTGQINAYNQVHLERNCEFEPSLNPGKDSVIKCLSEINTSFRWNKPAIITVHRVNFIGAIVKQNREENLRQFRELLRRILISWPEVEFMTSSDLGDLIVGKSERN